METRPISWPTVKTTITPSHYAYIAVTLSFLFPPEVAERITRLTKKCDEAQNLLDHSVLYVHTYMLNTLKNISLSPFSSMQLSEVCPSQKTMDTKKHLTGHIKSIGNGVNRAEQDRWLAWIGLYYDYDNKTVSKRMIDSITRENRRNREYREFTNKSIFVKLSNICVIVNHKKEEEKDYKKIVKKEKKKRKKMLKLQTPKQKMRFSKNQPRYNNRRIR